MSIRRASASSSWSVVARIACLLLCSSANFASAQITIVDTSQALLRSEPKTVQAKKLEEIVQRAWKGRACTQATISLEKTFKEQAGGWLVRCAEGQDYWVLILAEAGKAATVLPCILARTTARTDCYENFRTILPEHASECTESPHLDRVIGACTAIIQSARLKDRPDGLAIVYQSRGAAYARYQQIDLAFADFDRAVALNPDAQSLYNRAVALERMGNFDKAIADLDKVLRLMPSHPHASYERGFIHLKKQNYDRAIVDFSEAIRINPAYARAFRDRAAAYKAKGDLANAEADLKTAQQLESRNPSRR